jgi:plasmid stabilization system protein ParE
MKTYKVVVAPIAAEKIAEHGRYIAEVAGMPQTAERWIDRVYDKIAALNAFPHRFALAEEDRFRDYEIRRQIIGTYLVLYSIDEAAQAVHVIGFRHGRRLPRAAELPERIG